MLNLFRQTLYIFNVDLNIRCNPVVYGTFVVASVLNCCLSQLRFFPGRLVKMLLLSIDEQMWKSTVSKLSAVISMIWNFFLCCYQISTGE